MKYNNVVIVGSGVSATESQKWDLSNKILVCVNNAWMLHPDRLDYWVHSGDFPMENCPKYSKDKEISCNQYGESIKRLSKKHEWVTKSPLHYVGYCIFFISLYWVIEELNPEKIGTIGCDFRYPKEVVKKWKDEKMPNIQNHFLTKEKVGHNEFASKMFNGMGKSHFYGYGLPDPMRLGDDLLKNRFERAKTFAKENNIKVVNYSKEDGINSFKREIYK